MKFLETSESLKADDIANIEEELKIKFPEEFKEHYLNYNGGYPENDKYVWSNGEKTTINTFASIKYNGFTNLEDDYKNLVLLEHYLPVGIIPFATDDGGNIFCISSREKDFGFVYYCNNDHYNVDDKEECLSLLDKSYKHFIKKLSN